MWPNVKENGGLAHLQKKSLMENFILLRSALLKILTKISILDV